MIISLHTPSEKSMDRLLNLSKDLHSYEALPFDSVHARAAFEHLIEFPHKGDVFLVDVETDGHTESIGFVVLCYSFSIEFGGQIAVIDQVYLSQDWRRQGVGSYVIPKLEEIAVKKGNLAMILEVNIGNGGAREFYEQFDYMPRRQHCIMAKRLKN